MKSLSMMLVTAGDVPSSKDAQFGLVPTCEYRWMHAIKMPLVHGENGDEGLRIESPSGVREHCGQVWSPRLHVAFVEVRTAKAIESDDDDRTACTLAALSLRHSQCGGAHDYEQHAWATQGRPHGLNLEKVQHRKQ